MIIFFFWLSTKPAAATPVHCKVNHTINDKFDFAVCVRRVVGHICNDLKHLFLYPNLEGLFIIQFSPHLLLSFNTPPLTLCLFCPHFPINFLFYFIFISLSLQQVGYPHLMIFTTINYPRAIFPIWILCYTG